MTAPPAGSQNSAMPPNARFANKVIAALSGGVMARAGEAAPFAGREAVAAEAYPQEGSEVGSSTVTAAGWV